MKVVVFILILSCLPALSCQLNSLNTQKKYLEASLLKVQKDEANPVKSLRKVTFLGDGMSIVRIVFKTTEGIRSKTFNVFMDKDCKVSFKEGL